MARMFIQLVIVVAVLAIVWFFMRSVRQPAPGKRTFRPRTFNEIRKEVNKGELKQDPVSGTYVSAADAITRTIDGTVYYFSSEENAEQFVKSRRV